MIHNEVDIKGNGLPLKCFLDKLETVLGGECLFISIFNSNCIRYSRYLEIQNVSNTGKCCPNYMYPVGYHVGK